MTAMSTASASMLAHGVHYGLVLGGLCGVVLLLGPQLLARSRVRRSLPSTLSSTLSSTLPRDPHEQRVALLREGLATGTLTRVPAALLLEAPAVVRGPVPGSRTALPLAVVASAAAAGAHAAVGPAHLGDQLRVGTFFLLCALAQLAWSALVLRRSSTGLLLLGLVGNLAVLAVWLVSRTSGVPGVHHGAEPFGPWDLTCAAWELVVVGCCAARLLTGRADEGVAPWAAWTPSTNGLLAASVLALGVLSLSGAAA